MNLITIFSILAIHWFADFVCQTDKQAKNKSTNIFYLLEHTIIYSLIWVIPMFFMLPTINVLPFWFITFIFHTITDYFTSRLNTYLWNKGDIHNFFVSIGFDQLLHYIQLFGTYYLLLKL